MDYIKEIREQMEYALSSARIEVNMAKEMCGLYPTTENNAFLQTLKSNLNILEDCEEQIKGLVSNE